MSEIAAQREARQITWNSRSAAATRNTLGSILGSVEGDDAVDDSKDQICGDENKSGRTTREAPARACSIHIDLQQSRSDLIEE